MCVGGVFFCETPPDLDAGRPRVRRGATRVQAEDLRTPASCPADRCDDATFCVFSDERVAKASRATEEIYARWQVACIARATNVDGSGTSAARSRDSRDFRDHSITWFSL